MRTWHGVAAAGALALAAGAASAQPITEGFEDVPGLTAQDWFIANHSDVPDPTDPGWSQGIDDPRISAHTGTPTSYPLSSYFATLGQTGTETISNWLVLPTRTLRNGDTLRFWARCITPLASVFPDRMQVRLSTAGASTNIGITSAEVGDFTTLLLDINPTYATTPPTNNPPTNGFPNVWTQYTLVLGGLPPAGAPGRLAFRHFMENSGPGGPNGNTVGIDDLEYVPASGTSCYPDCNGDHALNVNDFVCFGTAFAGGNMAAADCNHDNTLNVNDFVCFQAAFAAGCSAP